MPVTLDPTFNTANIAYSNGNLTASARTSNNFTTTRTTAPVPAGQWYFEVLCNNVGGTGTGIGVTNQRATNTNYIGSDANGAGCQSNGYPQIAGAGGTQITAYTTGNTVCVAVDTINQKIWFRVNAGNWDNTTDNPATNTGGYSLATPLSSGGTLYPAIGTYASADQLSINLGDIHFAQAVPAGFSGVNPLYTGPNTTWNLFDNNCALSNGLLTAYSSGFGYQGARTTSSVATGKYYWECTFNDTVNNACGIADAAYVFTNSAGSAGSAAANHSGPITINGSGVATIAAIAAGQACGIALDLNAQLIWFRNSSTGSQWNGSGTANPATGIGGVAVTFVGGGVAAYGLASSQNANGSGAITGNFGGSAFVGAVPAGFSAGFPGPGTDAAASQAYVMVMA